MPEKSRWVYWRKNNTHFNTQHNINYIIPSAFGINDNERNSDMRLALKNKQWFLMSYYVCLLYIASLFCGFALFTYLTYSRYSLWHDLNLVFRFNFWTFKPNRKFLDCFILWIFYSNSSYPLRILMSVLNQICGFVLNSSFYHNITL